MKLVLTRIESHDYILESQKLSRGTHTHKYDDTLLNWLEQRN